MYSTKYVLERGEYCDAFSSITRFEKYDLVIKAIEDQDKMDALGLSDVYGDYDSQLFKNIQIHENGNITSKFTEFEGSEMSDGSGWAIIKMPISEFNKFENPQYFGNFVKTPIKDPRWTKAVELIESAYH